VLVVARARGSFRFEGITGRRSEAELRPRRLDGTVAGLVCASSWVNVANINFSCRVLSEGDSLVASHGELRSSLLDGLHLVLVGSRPGSQLINHPSSLAHAVLRVSLSRNAACFVRTRSRCGRDVLLLSRSALRSNSPSRCFQFSHVKSIVGVIGCASRGSWEHS